MDFFTEFLWIYGAALLSALLFKRVGLPSIIAYLVAGAAIGPSALGLVADPTEYSLLAEFGVVLLLFALGLEFSLPKLFAMRATVFGVGGGQVLLCMAIFGIATYVWGTTPTVSFLIAASLALSSTAIVTKELADIGQVHTDHGRLSVGVLLFQDLAAVAFLIVVPVLGATSGSDVSLSSELWSALVKGIILVLVLLAVGRWLLPVMFSEVARAESDEIFLLSTMVVVLVAAWVTHALGLSMALGAFVIGMMLGESHFRHQINSDIRGFKDLLLGLFFVSVGMNVEVSLLVEYWPRLILFALALVAIKFASIAMLIRVAGHSKVASLRAGLNLAQAGEFGLALLTIGFAVGLIPADQASFIAIVAVMSMAVSPLLIRRADQLVARFDGSSGGQTEQAVSAAEELTGHVVVGGYGRVGRVLVTFLKSLDIPYVVIERNVSRVKEARQDGANVTYGDCTRLDMLKDVHMRQARLAVLTFDSLEQAEETIAHIRTVGCQVPVLVRTYDHFGLDSLVSLGANHVVPEMREGAILIAEQMSIMLDVPRDDIDKLVSQVRNNTN